MTKTNDRPDTLLVNNWLERFQSNSLRIGFRLYLSRAMLEYLCATADDVKWDRSRFGGITFPDNFMGTEHALVARGLVERKPPQVISEHRHDDGPFAPCQLTPAGRAVVELLKIGGLFITAEESLEKMRKRRGRN